PGLAGDRIVHAGGRERKGVLWERPVFVLRAGAHRLAELVVEEHSARARRVGERTVEDLARPLVLVEAEAHEIAQEAPALRAAEADHGTRRARRIGGALRVAFLVAQEGQEIAGGGEADAVDARIARRIVELVERPGRRQSSGRQQADLPRVDVAPPARGNLLPRILFPAPYRKLRLRLIECCS